MENSTNPLQDGPHNGDDFSSSDAPLHDALKLEDLIAQSEEKAQQMEDRVDSGNTKEKEETPHESSEKKEANIVSEEIAFEKKEEVNILEADALKPQEEDTSRKKKPLEMLKEKSSFFVTKVKSLFGKKKDVVSGTGSHLVSQEEDNVFTKMFSEEKKSSPEEVLIQNIISQSRKKKDAESDSDKEDAKKKKKILDLKNQEDAKKLLNEEEEKQRKAQELLQTSKIFTGASLIFPIISFLISSLFLSTDGFLSTIIESKNYGIIHQNKELELERLEQDIQRYELDIDDYVFKISEIQDNEVLRTIASKRIQWREVFEELEALTNKTFEGNVTTHQVVYNNYAGDSERMELKVSGTIVSPLGKSFNELIKLKNALNKYEHFSGVEIKQFTKSECSENPDSEDIEVQYCSPFYFTFQYNRDGDETMNASAPDA